MLLETNCESTFFCWACQGNEFLEEGNDQEGVEAKRSEW
jgi:hypothetical protein